VTIADLRITAVSQSAMTMCRLQLAIARLQSAICKLAIGNLLIAKVDSQAADMVL
jgi:hypothetical protein